MTPEELEREKEANRQAVAAGTIMYETAGRMEAAKIGPACGITAMLTGAFRHADQLSAQEQLGLLRKIEHFVDERCSKLEAAGYDVSRYADLREQLRLEDAA